MKTSFVRPSVAEGSKMEWMIMMMTYSQPAREPEREREGKYAAKDGEDARSHAFLGIENARGRK